MKTRTKKVLVCGLAVVLLCAFFAVPVNARGVFPANTYKTVTPVHWPNDAGSVVLNISTTENPYQNANVNLYSPTGHDTQTWILKNIGSDGYWRLLSKKNESYALNVWRGTSNYFNCDVHTWSDNLYDSAVASLNYEQYGYILELQNYSHYELNTGTSGNWSSGQNVKWIYFTSSAHTWV